MKLKIVGLALLLGTITSILVLILPTPNEIGTYDGFGPLTPTSSFKPSSGLCIPFPFEYSASKVKVGTPLTYTLTVDFNGCEYPGRTTAAKLILISAFETWQFYANWLIWTLPYLAVGMLIKKQTKH